MTELTEKQKEQQKKEIHEMTGEEIVQSLVKLSKTGLRPCPFCGSVSLSLITVRGEYVPLVIECNDCGATGPNDTANREDPKRNERLRLLWDTRRGEI